MDHAAKQSRAIARREYSILFCHSDCELKACLAKVVAYVVSVACFIAPALELLLPAYVRRVNELASELASTYLGMLHGTCRRPIDAFSLNSCCCCYAARRPDIKRLLHLVDACKK